MFPDLSTYYYEIIDKIGAGGTGEVFLARDIRAGYNVAIKSLHKKMFVNDFVKDKFIEEANLYLYLEHPNIASLKDFIITDEAYYLVMEYIDGLILSDFMSGNDVYLKQDLVIGVFNQILAALGYAHAQKVYHLDIKPGNIMVENYTEQVKVIDFGIASTQKDVIILDKPIGTPAFMSPEQIQGLPLDFRSDLYSVGVTLFQVLTETFPYAGTTTKEELFEKIINEQLPSVHSLNPFLNPQFDQVISKATMKLPEERYQSADEFILDLINIDV